MTHFEAYRASLEADLGRGNATEHTYRSALKALLESLFSGVVSTNDPNCIRPGLFLSYG